MFLMAPLDGKLLSVPGIGKKHMDQLKEGENGIVSSFQVFLLLSSFYFLRALGLCLHCPHPACNIIHISC